MRIKHTGIFRRGAVLLLSILLLQMAVVSCAPRTPSPAAQTTEPETDQKSSEQGRALLVWQIEAPAQNLKIVDELVKIWQDPLNRLLKEKGARYQVRIEGFTSSSKDNAPAPAIETIKAMKAAGSPVDLISTGVFSGYQTANPYLEYVKSALLMPLDDFLQTEKGLRIKKSLHEKDLKLAAVEGKIYGLAAVLPTTGAYMYNEKILEKAAISPDELNGDFYANEDLLKKVKEKIGSVPFSANWVDPRYDLGMFIPSYCENLALQANGQFGDVAASPEFRECLLRLFRWKQDGLLECPRPADAGDTSAEAFVQAYPSECFRTTPYTTSVLLGAGEKASRQKVRVVPDIRQSIMALYRGDCKTGISTWTRSRENAQDFLSKLFSDPDVANLIQFGVEGEDYKAAEGGYIEPIRQNVFLQTFAYQYTNSLLTHSTLDMPLDKRAYQNEFFAKHAAGFPYGFRFDPRPVASEIAASNEVFGLFSGTSHDSFFETALMALKTDDPARDIDQLISALDKAGMNKIVAEANRQLGEWRKKWAEK